MSYVGQVQRYQIADDIIDASKIANLAINSNDMIADSLITSGKINLSTAFSFGGVVSVLAPVSDMHAATKKYVDQLKAASDASLATEISNLIGGAPAALDTLNELAASLADDASLASTVVTNIAALKTELRGTVSASGPKDFGLVETRLGSADTAIALETTNRTSADTTLQGNINTLSASLTSKDTAQSAALTAEINARTTAVSNLTSTVSSNDSSVRTAFASADATILSDSKTYTDGKITVENSAMLAADAVILSSAQSYTNTQISSLIGSAPGVLDTLGELSAAMGADGSFATTVATNLAASSAAIIDGATTYTSLKKVEDKIAGLDTADSTEKTQREAADTTLQNNINTLSGTVSSNNTSLTSKINTDIANLMIDQARMSFHPQVDFFTGSGGNVAFTLSEKIKTGFENILVLVNGVPCKKVGASPASSQEFTLSGTDNKVITLGGNIDGESLCAYFMG